MTGPALSAEQKEIAEGIRTRGDAHERAGQQPARHGAHRERRGAAAARMEFDRGDRRQRAAPDTTVARCRVTVRTDVPADLPLVECDAVLIERVLVNLLENAAKYTPPTATVLVTARVDARRDARHRRRRRAGHPPRARNRDLREVHARRSASRRSAASASDWRSARRSSKRTADRSSVRQPGHRGAEFTFTLPIGEPPPLAPEHEDAAAQGARMTEPRPLVLIVEDERAIRRSFAPHSMREGMERVRVRDAEPGDGRMPRRDGTTS